MKILWDIIVMGPPLLMAVILHEIAHGWVAEKLGDTTARRMGRITLNPIAHIDPFMTIILPGILILSGSPFVFGGAKPVPVNPLHFKNPRRGMAIVAIAGPVTNFLLVSLFWPMLLVFRNHPELVSQIPLPTTVILVLLLWLQHGILANLVLGLFNLLPIPPLDGGRIAVGFLPLSLAAQFAKLERFGLLIVVLLMTTGIVEKVLGPIVEYFAMKFFQ